MNSSIEALREASSKLQKINSWYSTNNNGLSKIASSAYRIEEIIANSNQGLREGWIKVGDTVSNFSRELNNAICDLTQDLNIFIETTKNNEQEALSTVKNTIDISNELLKKIEKL